MSVYVILTSHIAVCVCLKIKNLQIIFSGTTYSCIGAYHAVSGRVDVIADAEGHQCIPSVVAFRLVGNRVVN